MEHRCTGRSKASRKVLIHAQKGQELKGFLRDVSREGMFIQIDVKGMRKGDMIDIEVTSGCCICGWVVHIGDEGVGVIFVPPLAERTGSSSPLIPLSNTCLKCLEFDKST